MSISIGLLISGGLGESCLKQLQSSHTIEYIFTDGQSKGIIKYAEQNGIPFFVGNPRTQNPEGFLQRFNEDIILSINYLFIVEENIFSHPKKYAINFHGSLLPKYRGRTPHVWAIINNETKTGITAHLISKGCDEGDIVDREEIEIPATATGSDILDIFKAKYPELVNRVIKAVENNTLTLTAQDNQKATYFGKRTAEDGQINWDWQKERINNWVRAQAKPYPMAFTFYQNQKISINKISFSDVGFDYQDQNGKILTAGDHPVVKTPNGAIQLDEWQSENEITITEGEYFNGIA